MKEIFNKTLGLKSNRYPKNLSINIKNISQNHISQNLSYQIQFKNSITSKTSFQFSFENIFFQNFPYQNLQNIETDYRPCRFTNHVNNFNYLLSENNQLAKKEDLSYINYLKNLIFFGTLKQNENKSVFLDIDQILPNLIFSNLDENITKNHNFNINVISKQEHEKYDVLPIKELNQKFKFKIKDLYSININKEDYSQKIWFLEIESEDLENLRSRYHLFSKANGHDFFITLGSARTFSLRKHFPLMRINIAFIAA